MVITQVKAYTHPYVTQVCFVLLYFVFMGVKVFYASMAL